MRERLGGGGGGGAGGGGTVGRSVGPCAAFAPASVLCVALTKPHQPADCSVVAVAKRRPDGRLAVPQEWGQGEQGGLEEGGGGN